MEPPVKLNCQECHKDFLRAAKEVRRNAKRGRPTFCSLSCAFKPTIRRLPRPDNYKYIRGKYGIKDEYSIFRPFLNRAQRRRKITGKSAPTVSLEYLKKIWDLQDGICPYTKLKMELPKCYPCKGFPLPNSPSLDRIDSSKGYEEGNIEFVCLAINYAKNGWLKETMLDFISNIRGSPKGTANVQPDCTGYIQLMLF